jgi:hypothetical protein
VNDLNDIDFESMTPANFEEVLPDLFAAGNGRVSEDPRLRKFLDANPDCAALVRDLETIAEHAKSLFEPLDEPSPDVWEKIKKEL